MASETQASAEEIQRQMQSVRSSLRADVKELVDNARDMTDWHYYVRRYPLGSVAVAAAAGFLVTSLGAKSAAHAIPPPPIASSFGTSPQPQPQQPPPQPPPGSSSWMSDLMSFGAKAATTALTRAAWSLASQQLSKFVEGSRLAAADIARKENPVDVQSHF